jgi:ATP-binding cassette subfamily B protein
MKLPFYRQTDTKDCGPTCLKMIFSFYGKNVDIGKLSELSMGSREGTSLHGLRLAAEKLGLKTLAAKISYQDLMNAPLPCIAHWNSNHFIVIYKISTKKIEIADPAHGIITYTKQEFIKNWCQNSIEGIVLLFDTSISFYNDKTEVADPNKSNYHDIIIAHFKKHNRAILQLILGLIAGSILQLIFPFLTQSIIDIGVVNSNMGFIYLILASQLLIFIGKSTVDIMRGWILMHISSRVSISLVSDFLIKIMKLPISFFDSKITGDILQKINDHYRIESFLTSSSLMILFSFINFFAFSIVLACYDINIFFILLFCTILYFVWILFFMKKRADLDYKRFSQNSASNSKIIELVEGMQEIKLNNAERKKRWEWESIQVKLYNTNRKALILEQFQTSGSSLINELKNIFISFYSAQLVIQGEITLGMMLSISYIIGQLNGPILQLVGFVQSFQDAKLSLIRISEVHNLKEESISDTNEDIDTTANLTLNNISFTYHNNNNPVLKNLSLIIPNNKITAIVGSSGSGKTTLMKLLLKFYEPSSGDIRIGTQNLKNITNDTWRSTCGAVLQEGFIFSDTVSNNITLSEHIIDKERLNYSMNMANIKDEIELFPQGVYTKIGIEGIGISAGQKQRILIARAIYKNPKFLFFDEATSSLDANNEKMIVEKLYDFFKNRTVVIIAHRLSTVKYADNIIVLDKGDLIESGNHKDLVSKRGHYFNLINNQLEFYT